MSMLVEAAAQQRSEMSLNVPPEFERAVRERVQSGAFASPDDVFLAALAALQVAEADEAESELLRREIEVGIHSAENEPAISGDEVIARLRARVQSGRYDSTEDVLQASLVALDDAEAEDSANDALRREIDIGIAELDRGEGIPGDVAFAEIRAEVRRMTGR
jgi:antitoxin ParD1/3/4